MRKLGTFCLLACLSDAPRAQDAPVPCTPAILSLQLDDLAGLGATRTGKAIAAMFAALFEQLPRDASRGTFESMAALVRSVRPPLTIDFHGVRNGQAGQAFVVALPEATPPLAPTLHEILKDEPSTPLEVKDAATELVGSVMRLQRGPLSWLDGTWAGQRTALLLNVVDARAEDWLAGLAAARERSRRARLEELAAALGAAPVILRVDFPALLRTLAREQAGSLHIVTSILGARFAGMVMTVRPDGDRIVCEGLLDVGHETGLLGKFVRAPARVPPLLARVPADAEFGVLDCDPDGIADLIRLAKTLVRDEAVPFDAILAFLADHWDGQLATVTAPSKLEQAIDPEAAEPFLLMLGSADGFAARKKLLELLREFGNGGTGPEPGQEPGKDEAWALRVEGETMAHLGAQQDFVALLGPDPESLAMFARVVAAQGKGGIDARELPPPFRGGFSIAGRSSPLSDLSGRVTRNDLRGRAVPADTARRMAELIVQHLGHEPTFGGARVEATTTRFWAWN